MRARVALCFLGLAAVSANEAARAMNARVKIVWQFIQRPLMQLQQRLNLRISKVNRNSNENTMLSSASEGAGI
jgi:hypothetical protein